MKINNLHQPEAVREIIPNRSDRVTLPGHENAFANVLEEKLQKQASDVKFSAHAVERLSSRNILLNERDISKLDNGFKKIAEKGGRESLMIMGDLTFVVNIKNKTVITTVDNKAGQQDKVFTNIDSALII